MARRQLNLRRTQGLLAGIAIIVVAAMTFGILQADSDLLIDRSLTLNENRAGKTAQYKFSFQPPGLGVIQNVVFQVCSNDPIPGRVCDAPAGFNASGATLVSQSGDQGFSLSSQTTANKIVLSRPPLSSSGGQDTYELSGVVNPSADGSYYVRVLIFPDSNTDTGYEYQGGIAFVINQNVSVQATVPPYLLFCVGITVTGYDCSTVSGDYVDFGEFNSRQVSQGSTQMLAASNAIDGYNIRVLGSTLTSGNNIIPALTSSDVSRPGISQFGMNLRANSSPQGGTDASGPGFGVAANGYNQINFYRFNSGEVVASTTRPDEARKYTASYIVNIQKDQSPGVYVSTLTYVALGSY